MPKKHGVTDEKWAASSYIEWATFGKVGDSDSGEAFSKTQDVPTTIRVDDSGTYIYIGYAIPGSSEDDAVWRIARIDVNGNKLWADGNSLYDNVWSDRVGLSYL